jgi:hypothetical protein
MGASIFFTAAMIRAFRQGYGCNFNIFELQNQACSVGFKTARYCRGKAMFLILSKYHDLEP